MVYTKMMINLLWMGTSENGVNIMNGRKYQTFKYRK